MNCTELNFTARQNLNSSNGCRNYTLRIRHNNQNQDCQPELNMAVFLPIAVLTALINGLVFFLFYKRKKLRTPGNYVLLSLALSDFITGALDIPIYITYCVRNESRFIPAFEVLCKLTAILTAYHIVAVTAEKYIAIVKPFQHRSANPKTSFIIVGMIWILSSVIAVLPVVWKSFLSGNPETRKTRIFLHLGHDVFCFIAVFLIPCIFIVHAQIAMFRAISSRTKQFNKEMRGTKKSHRGKACVSQERKCIAVFATMAILFVVCWLPWFILSFCATMTALDSKLFPIMLRLSPLLEAFAIIRFSTCIINPILYTFFKRDFLEALKTTCPCSGVHGDKQSISLSYEQKKNNYVCATGIDGTLI